MFRGMITALILCTVGACNHPGEAATALQMVPADVAAKLARHVASDISFDCSDATALAEDATAAIQCERPDTGSGGTYFSLVLVATTPDDGMEVDDCDALSAHRPRVSAGPNGASFEILCLLSGEKTVLRINHLERLGAAMMPTDLRLTDFAIAIRDHLERRSRN